MGTKNRNRDNVDFTYSYWMNVSLKSQLIIAIAIFITELVINTLLYVTRSQGYSPDNVVQKFMRYFVLTSVINFGCVLVSWIYSKRSSDFDMKNMVILSLSVVICTDVAFSHYQFAPTLCIFIVPLINSIVFEDLYLCTHVLTLSSIGLLISVIARGLDHEYNKDIVPEGMIALTLLVCMYIFARIIIAGLQRRREELGNALLDAEKAKTTKEQNKISLNMLETLARALDAKDKYTNGHASRVSIYSTMLAEAVGMDPEEITRLKFEALLHDIGKIGIPDAVLNKPDKLTDMEFSIIKSHSVLGSNILKDLTVFPGAADVAKFHHERYDGKGYPSGLAGEKIPYHARITCIADCYDAMSSDRIYRSALPKDVIREELVKGRGTQFDPELLDAFLVLFDSNKLNVDLKSQMSELPENTADVVAAIENVLWHINNQDGVNDFKKFYVYMRNIGLRYDRSVEVVSIRLHISNDVICSDAEFAVIRNNLRTAIHKNIRAVDMHFDYSENQQLIIFLDAGIENIDVIVERIYFDFYKNNDQSKIMLTHKINSEVEL